MTKISEPPSIMTLPVDIMIVIFLKLLKNPLFRCRCVCKLWRNTINNSSFADEYRKGSPARQSQLMLFRHTYLSPKTVKVYAINPRLSNDTFRLSQLPIDEFTVDNKRIGNLGHGLFLFEGVPSFLYHPMRGEKLTLPPVEEKVEKGTHKFCTHGLGFNYSTKQYKLVRVTQYHNDMTLEKHKFITQVHTLGSNRWKQIDAVPSHWFKNMGLGMPAYGDIHWHALHDIVSFKVTKEEFKVTRIPNVIAPRRCHLFNWMEDLAVVDISSCSNMIMWVLRDYENTRWEKLYTMPLVCRQIGIDLGGKNDARIIGTWEEDIVFRTRKLPSGLYCCNPKTGDERVIKSPSTLLTNNEFFHSCTINLDSLASHGIVASTRAPKRKAGGLFKHNSSSNKKRGYIL